MNKVIVIGCPGSGKSTFANSLLRLYNLEKDTLLIDALVSLKAASSKREARDFINGGGVLVNGVQQKSLEFVISKENAIGNTYTVIRRGKKNYYLIEHK